MLALLADTEEEIESVRELVKSEDVRGEEDGEETAADRVISEGVDGSKEEVVREEVEDELSEWLSGLEGDMQQYAPILREQGFDSLAAVKTLNKTDMKVLKIKKGHIRVLKQAIAKLKERDNEEEES